MLLKNSKRSSITIRSEFFDLQRILSIFRNGRSAHCSCGCYHNNTVPPSIMMVFPVAKEKLSLATHAATLATSSGLPHLFIDGSEAALSLSYSVIDPYVANVAILPRAKV